MSVSVLVVDDSGFFRKRVCEILNSVQEITVVAVASNGREAIELVKKHSPDVVTMDYEMPVMDGVTAIRHIMNECPTSILMFSSLTYEGARVTLDALEAGAVDFLPKNFEDIARDAGKMQEVLKQRILAIARKKSPTSSSEYKEGIDHKQGSSKAEVNVRPARIQSARNSAGLSASKPISTATLSKSNISRASSVRSKPISHPVDLLVIGASTGGPVALQKLLAKLPENFPCPILVVQHMPETFTPAFATRLNGLCQLTVKHGVDGDTLRPGVAILAPGAKQMIVTAKGRKISVLEGDERLTYKPSVDVTFGSASKAFPGRVLGVVLTGMGADGREGCRLLKQSGSSVYTQNEKSCVIYGMPMAVDKAGYSDGSFDIEVMAEQIIGGVM
jgi:two-component system, chemotaxis family, protein-glutamate methylesterase/glutaminase